MKGFVLLLVLVCAAPAVAEEVATAVADDAVATAADDAVATAADDETPAWAYAIANELMSPFCPGLTLADCPSPHAARVRMWIIGEANAGRSRAEVEAALFERYGDQVRAAPKAEGFGHFAYLAPLGVFLAGGAFLFWFLRRQVRRDAAPAAGAKPLDADAERELDEALSK